MSLNNDPKKPEVNLKSEVSVTKMNSIIQNESGVNLL